MTPIGLRFPRLRMWVDANSRCGELRRELRRVRGENAALHEVADTWQQRWREEHDARVDLETIVGWQDAT